MLRGYLARRKMRWAVRRVAAMSPRHRRMAESSRQVRRVWRVAERALAAKRDADFYDAFEQRRLEAHTRFWALTDAKRPDADAS